MAGNEGRSSPVAIGCTVYRRPAPQNGGRKDPGPARFPGKCGSWGNAPVCALAYEIHTAAMGSGRQISSGVTVRDRQTFSPCLPPRVFWDATRVAWWYYWNTLGIRRPRGALALDRFIMEPTMLLPCRSHVATVHPSHIRSPHRRAADPRSSRRRE